MVDFTAPDAALPNIRAAIEAGVPVGGRHERLGHRSRARRARPGLLRPELRDRGRPDDALCRGSGPPPARGGDRRAPPRDEARRALRTAKATAERLPRRRAVIPSGCRASSRTRRCCWVGKGQVLTIRHDALSREAYVQGVLLALERLDTCPRASPSDSRRSCERADARGGTADRRRAGGRALGGLARARRPAARRDHSAPHVPRQLPLRRGGRRAWTPGRHRVRLPRRPRPVVARHRRPGDDRGAARALARPRSLRVRRAGRAPRPAAPRTRREAARRAAQPSSGRRRSCRPRSATSPLGRSTVRAAGPWSFPSSTSEPASSTSSWVVLRPARRREWSRERRHPSGAAHPAGDRGRLDRRRPLECSACQPRPPARREGVCASLQLPPGRPAVDREQARRPRAHRVRHRRRSRPGAQPAVPHPAGRDGSPFPATCAAGRTRRARPAGSTSSRA